MVTPTPTTTRFYKSKQLVTSFDPRTS
jgi:hypothetical protein